MTLKNRHIFHLASFHPNPTEYRTCPIDKNRNPPKLNLHRRKNLFMVFKFSTQDGAKEQGEEKEKHMKEEK